MSDHFILEKKIKQRGREEVWVVPGLVGKGAILNRVVGVPVKLKFE